MRHHTILIDQMQEVLEIFPRKISRDWDSDRGFTDLYTGTPNIYWTVLKKISTGLQGTPTKYLWTSKETPTMPQTPMIDNKGYIDVDAAVRLKEAEGKIEIEKYELETEAKFKELEMTESAKEVASKHLAKFAGAYLTFLVALFIFSIKFVPESSLAVVAGLITLVVTNLSTILRHIVENGKSDKMKEEEEVEKKEQGIQK